MIEVLVAQATDDTDRNLRRIVAATVKMEDRADRIAPETNLFDLGLESLSVVALLTDVEQSFGIEIDVEDLSSGLFESYGALLAFVRTKLAQA